jgi:hypothetical protein
MAVCVTSLFLVAGCSAGSSPSAEVDSGSRGDDAGSVSHDASGGSTEDRASASSDASGDVGIPSDAGAATDAGGSSDASASNDSGGSSDSGASADTGGVTSEQVLLSGNRILDIAGVPIVARGAEDVVANASQTADVDTLSGMGSNAMRMLLTLDAANGMTPASFDAVLAEAVSRKMLVWVSLYTWDSANSNVVGASLGGGNFYALTAPSGTGTCSTATPGPCYLAMWSRQWLKDLALKYRANIIIDAGQEFIGTADPGTEAGRVEWATAGETNIQFMRSQGYTNPLQIMSNFSGRDLYAIVEYGSAVRAVDTVVVNGNPQTMFGWQAYWGTSDGYYPAWQGGLLLGGSSTLSGAQAIHQFAAAQPFPIEIGVDNYAGDTNLDYQAEIAQADTDSMSWLWWSWQPGSTVECPVSGATCQTYVTSSPQGFSGAKALTAP